MAIAAAQEHARIRTDSTAVNGGTPVWAAAQDANPATWVANTNAFRIRIQIAETGTTASGTSAWNIFCSRNGGAYAQVPASGGTYVNAADIGGTANGTAVTPGLLTAFSTYIGTVGVYNNTGTTGTLTTLPSGDCTEFEFGIAFTTAVLPGDTYAFRVYKAGVALNAATPYVFTPTVTITTVPIAAVLTPAQILTVTESQQLIAKAALAPAAVLSANAIIATACYPANLASGAAGLGQPDLEILLVPVNLSSTQPRQDATPIITQLLVAANLASGAAGLGTPTLSLSSGTAWAGSALLVPLTTWTVNEHQIQIAAFNVAVASALGSVAQQLDVSAASFNPLAALAVKEHQTEIAAINAAIAASVAVSERQYQIAAFNASIGPTLGINAQDYIFDLSEALASVTIWTVTEHQKQVASLTASVASVLATSEQQLQIAALSSSIAASLISNAQDYIFDPSELLAPATLWTVKEHQYQIAALNAAVAANVAVSERQYQIAKFSAAASATLSANTSGTNTWLGSALLTPLTAWSVNEHQIQIAAFNAAVASGIVVGEHQYQVAAINTSALSNFSANALDYIFDLSEAFVANNVFAASPIQRLIASSILGPTGILTATEAQRDAAAAVLSPAAGFSAAASTFIFDLAETLACSSSLGINLILNKALNAVNLAAGAAGLGQPACAAIYNFAATNLASSAARLGQPAATIPAYPLLAQTLAAGRSSIIMPTFTEYAVNHHSLHKMLRRLEVMGRISQANAESKPHQPPNLTGNNWRLPPP